jgi:hypothetical protein
VNDRANVCARLSRAMVKFFGRVRGVAEILCYKTRLAFRADYDYVPNATLTSSPPRYN